MMTAMSDSFVDLTYRGLPLGRRVKLSGVRPSTGYLEVPTPMPVGTAIAILTDDTVALEASVVEIHEQVGGSDRAPGMLVRPKLEGEAARAWWQQRVTLPELEVQPAQETPVPQAAGSIAIVPPKRVQRDTQIGMAVPEVVEEKEDTAVMEAIIDATSAPVRDSMPAIVDDGKKTTMMDSVDLAALGLTSPSGQMPAVTEEQAAAAVADDDDKKSSGKKKRKRKG